jgi:hypothetical protein
VADLIPSLGDAKGYYEAYTGVDTLTGEKLAWWERGLNLIPLVGRFARKGPKVAGLGSVTVR